MRSNQGVVANYRTARLGCLAALYLFAAPVYAIRFLVRTILTFVRFRQVRSGAVECPHCGRENPLDLLATCRRCGTTEFGSRLRCSNCGQTNLGFACDGCGALIRVL
jgi:4-hydroxy-3-methylbut-2-en-1-yl diphosphate synthase IspG/GcpE